MDEIDTSTPLLPPTELGSLITTNHRAMGRRRATLKLASSPLPWAGLLRSSISKQTAADLRAKIAINAAMSAALVPPAASPINGPPSGYNLARCSSYGTMTIPPNPSLYTIHEVAEPSSTEDEKRMLDIESQIRDNVEVAGLSSPTKWSPLIRLWVALLVLAWTWVMLLIIFGRLDVVVDLVYTPLQGLIPIFNFLTTPSGNVASPYGDAPFKITKGHHGHREHSGSGGGNQKSAAALSQAPCIWWSALVAASVYLTDVLLAGLL